MGLLKRISESKTAISVPQTYKPNPFNFLNGCVQPLNGHTNLYRELREAIPVIDAAIYKLVRLTVGFKIECSDEKNTEKINSFFETIPVGSNRYGIYEFISSFFEQLLTYGTAVGEMVTDKRGRLAALFNADLRNIELKKSDDGKTLNLIHENSMEEVLNDENLTECIRKLDLIKNEVKKAG